MDKSAALVTDAFARLGFFIISILAALILILIVAFAVRSFFGNRISSKNQSQAAKTFNYYLKGPLLTPAERVFLNCLDSIVPAEMRIFSKVRVADILAVNASGNRSARQTGFNKIDGKHVDFILCRSDDFTPLLVIELDDKTHKQVDRVVRDKFLNEIFAEARLPMLRFKVQHDYNSEEVANRLNEALRPANVSN